MRLRIFVAPLVLLAGRASPAIVDLRDRMVGLSETQLASCMGEPAQRSLPHFSHLDIVISWAVSCFWRKPNAATPRRVPF